MTFRQIAFDDLLLFGSLMAFAIGAAVVVTATSGDILLAVGVAMVVFGLPGVVIAFLAAAEVESK